MGEKLEEKIYQYGDSFYTFEEICELFVHISYEKKKQFKDIVDTFKENGVTIEKEEIEDNDTYYYFVSYSNNWNKKEESKQLEKPINFEFGRIKGIIEPHGDITYNKGYSKNNTSIKFNYYDEEVTPFAHTDKQKIVNYISKNILK